MKTRTLTLFLTALLLLLPLLSACGGSSSGIDDQTAAAETEPVETERQSVLPATDWNGRKFCLCLSYEDCYKAYWSPELDGEVVNDEKYYMCQNITDKYNFELTFDNGGGDSTGNGQVIFREYLTNLILSGDATKDVYGHVQHTGMPAMINEGYFMDWSLVEHIDFSQPWWNEIMIDSINFGTKIYTCMGTWTQASYQAVEMIMFNKTLCNDLGIEPPYQYVKDYTWVADKFIKIIADSTADLNGDSVMDYDNDRYGFAGWQYEQIPALYMGFGGKVLDKDPTTKEPILVVESERTNTVLETMKSIFEMDGSFYHGTTYALEDNMFSGGRLMFNDAFISQLGGYRDMEDDFGFVPYPMLDEQQDNYSSRIGNTATVFYLPVTNVTTDFTGFVISAFNEEAYYTVYPAYIDTVLTVKQTRDTESEEMIPYIRSTATALDSALGFSPMSAMQQGASYIAANLTAWETKLEELAETYA